MLSSLLIVDSYPETLALLGELFALDGRDVRSASCEGEAISRMIERPACVVWIDENTIFTGLIWPSAQGCRHKAQRRVLHHGCRARRLFSRADPQSARVRRFHA